MVVANNDNIQNILISVVVECSYNVDETTAAHMAATILHAEKVMNQAHPISLSVTLIIFINSFCLNCFSCTMYPIMEAIGNSNPKIINTGAVSFTVAKKPDTINGFWGNCTYDTPPSDTE